MNITIKYITSGNAIRTTSNGILIMYSPFNENITIIVNRSAIRVKGLIFGINLVLYHSLSFARIKINLVRKPVMNGIPR